MPEQPVVASHLLERVAKLTQVRTDADILHGLEELRQIGRWSGAEGAKRLLADFYRALDLCDPNLQRQVRLVLGLDSPTLVLADRREVLYGSANGTRMKNWDLKALEALLWKLLSLDSVPASDDATLEGLQPREVKLLYAHARRDDKALDVFTVSVAGVMSRRTRLLSIPRSIRFADPEAHWTSAVTVAGTEVQSSRVGAVLRDRIRLLEGLDLVVGLDTALEPGVDTAVQCGFSGAALSWPPEKPSGNEVTWTALGTEASLTFVLADSESDSAGRAQAYVLRPGRMQSVPLEVTTQPWPTEGKLTRARALHVEAPEAGATYGLVWGEGWAIDSMVD